MNAQTLLARLAALGVSIRVDGDQLKLNPGDRVPADMMPELKAHKQDIMAILQGCSLKYPGQDTSQTEAEEIAAAVAEQGICLVWSGVLNEVVCFVAPDSDAVMLPAGFVTYSTDELRVLFGSGDGPSVAHLKRIHAAKKFGGTVIQS